MELVIVGAGAIGGITGAYLARAGHRVLLVDREADHVEAIKRDGLQIGGISEFTVRIPAALPRETAGPVRALVLAVKTLHTREALEPFVPRLASDGFVLSMQNGLEEEKIAAMVGRERTIGASLTFGGYYERPGRLIYSGPASLHIGELDGRITPRVVELARVLSDFHPAEPTANISGFLWGKLILGALYFATATVDADVVDILGHGESRQILARLVAEALQTAVTLGIRVEPVDGFDPLALGVGAGYDPAAAEAAWQAQVAYWSRGLAKRTGVWRDLAIRRRQTEAGPILGALTAAAAEAGRRAPRVAALLRIIREIEEVRRPLDWANLREIDAAG